MEFDLYIDCQIYFDGNGGPHLPTDHQSKKYGIVHLNHPSILEMDDCDVFNLV